MPLKILRSGLQVPIHPLGLSDKWLLPGEWPRSTFHLSYCSSLFWGREAKGGDIHGDLGACSAFQPEADHWLSGHTLPASKGEVVSSGTVQQNCNGRTAGDILRSAEAAREETQVPRGRRPCSCGWLVISSVGPCLLHRCFHSKSSFYFPNACLTVELICSNSAALVEVGTGPLSPRGTLIPRVVCLNGSFWGTPGRNTRH